MMSLKWVQIDMWLWASFRDDLATSQVLVPLPVVRQALPIRKKAQVALEYTHGLIRGSGAKY